jgi:excinuclease ABC subunit C
MAIRNVTFDIAQLKYYPTAPGVYIMKGARGEVLYIGKAKNLRTRLRSYFTDAADERYVTKFLVERVATIDYLVTTTEKEAFLLENTLIKRQRPRYNIRLRDDKTYISLRLNVKQEFPRLELVRRRKKDGAFYFGPYTSTHAVRDVVQLLQKIFPLRSCKDSVFRNRTRPCVLYQIGKCLGPCVYEVDREEYAKLVRGVILFLEGKEQEVVRMLEERMKAHAEAMEFEKAARVRDQIAAVRTTIERQRVASHGLEDRDVIAHWRIAGRCAVVVLSYRDGVLVESRDFVFADHGEETGKVLYAFISQFYHEQKYIPAEILVEDEPDERALLEEWLEGIKGRRVAIGVPQRGEKRRLVELAIENARGRLERAAAGDQDRAELLEEARKKLRLKKTPRRIECVDISNIGGMMAVGALVLFVDGEADKSGYRLFKIRSVQGADDYAMMREVLERHFRRVQAGEKEMPDLLLADGGKGQLNIAREVLKSLSVKGVEMAALAKGRVEGRVRRKGVGSEEEHVYVPGRKNAIVFRSHRGVLHLLQRVRDEAHRFAISYYQRLHRKRNLQSLLDELEGIGPKRKRILLRHFGSLARIKSASRDELRTIPGIPVSVGESLYEFFHRQ